MSEVADRYRRISGQFMQRAQVVPNAAWENPAPCEGWVARDVVRHMVEWMPGFVLTAAGLDDPAGPPVDDDPVGAWAALSDAIQAALDDPAVAGREYDSPAGRFTVDDAVSMFCIGDVLVHTWDLARATGLDESLDRDEVRHQLASMAPYEQAMRDSGHYGTRVEVPADADDQTRLIAFTGRRP